MVEASDSHEHIHVRVCTRNGVSSMGQDVIRDAPDVTPGVVNVVGHSPASSNLGGPVLLSNNPRRNGRTSLPLRHVLSDPPLAQIVVNLATSLLQLLRHLDEALWTLGLIRVGIDHGGV